MTTDTHDHSGHDHSDHGGHDHSGHDHSGHAHTHQQPTSPPPSPKTAGKSAATRYIVAAVVVAIAVTSACFSVVRQGSALVITRFGDPIEVCVEPQLAWRLPAPIERTVDVDLRTHTTPSGNCDVGTKDGLRLVMEAYVAWRIPPDGEHVKKFMRAVRNQPDEAGLQLRKFLYSSLETVAARFQLLDLVNTDPQKVRLVSLESMLKQSLEKQMLDGYGIEIMQVGISRLMLPQSTSAATISRMIEERRTAAEEHRAEGSRQANEISSAAERDSRIRLAEALVEASKITTDAEREAAVIRGTAQARDPELYSFLRELDVLDLVMNSQTRLILRTDAEPFRALVDGPAGPPHPKPPILHLPPLLPPTPSDPQAAPKPDQGDKK